MLEVCLERERKIVRRRRSLTDSQVDFPGGSVTLKNNGQDMDMKEGSHVAQQPNTATARDRPQVSHQPCKGSGLIRFRLNLSLPTWSFVWVCLAANPNQCFLLMTRWLLLGFALACLCVIVWYNRISFYR